MVVASAADAIVDVDCLWANAGDCGWGRGVGEVDGGFVEGEVGGGGVGGAGGVHFFFWCVRFAWLE
jgi:hypothetical protein